MSGRVVTPKTSGCALEALAGRVEALTGPDREVDRLIYESLNPTHISVKGMSSRYYDPSRINMLSAQKYITKWTYFASRYTASLDAAMTLLDDEWYWRVGHDGEGADPSVFRADVGYVVRDDAGGVVFVRCRGEIPAIALTAAALRARARQATSAAIGGDRE